MSAFIETINFNNQVVILSQGCKLIFSKPTWVHKTGSFVRALYARGTGGIAPTSEPKIVVVNSTLIFQFGYQSAASIRNPRSYGTYLRMAIRPP